MLFRPGTLDQNIYEQIHRRDEYRMGARTFGPDDAVLDIGGHAGFFALLALQRGAGSVWVYEISQENIALCRRHLSDYAGRARIHRLAVWNASGLMRSFGDFPLWENDINTGGLSLYGGGPFQVPTIAFDEVVEQASDGFRRRIRLVKMDVEGAEWPILLGSRSLGHIDEIVGEYHEIGGDWDDFDPASVGLPGFTRYTRRELVHGLRRAGFRVRLDEGPRRFGHFFARRSRLRRWMDLLRARSVRA